MSEPKHDGQFIHDGTIYHDGETTHRWREYESEFDVLDMRYHNASIHRRPDAISPDYLTCFTSGPIAQGDVSAGIVSRLWRIRVVGHEVMVSRTNAGFR